MLHFISDFRNSETRNVLKKVYFFKFEKYFTTLSKNWNFSYFQLSKNLLGTLKRKLEYLEKWTSQTKKNHINQKNGLKVRCEQLIFDEIIATF